MSAQPDWLEANRQHLLAALARVRQALERHVAARDGTPVAPPTEEPEPATEPTFTLDILVGRFGLSAFERDLLLLAAGPELEGRFESLLAAAHGDARTGPTFSLGLAVLPGAHWSAATPAGPLRRWRLLETTSGNTLMSSPLRIDERVLHFLVGTPHPDERLRGILEPVAGAPGVPPARTTAAADLARRCWAGSEGGRLPVLALHGGDAELRRMLAAEVAAAVGSRILAVRTDAIPAAADERVDLIRLIERECVLSDALLLVEQTDTPAERAAERPMAPVLQAVGIPVIVSGEHPPILPGRALVLAEVPPLSHAELGEAWRHALGERAAELNGALDRAAAQFRLGLNGVSAIGAALRHAPAGAGPSGPEGPLWALCRAYARPRLEGLAERIEPGAGWEQLVLPPAQLDALRSVALHVRHRVLVHQQWGFADRSGRGQGITALFAGPSGTGKTMAAEVLANELQLDLYRIDLSQVVSKYIGETEKNLRRVFDAAEGGSAILLFDEADALFGKRSEVKDSHDRYANIEVSYLLQRMEAYTGLAILTTNLAAAIDPAFLRRLRFSVTFPFPDAGARADIWRRIFPAATPTEGVDPQRLARLSVAGGNIRNIALHAAFYAADAGEPVRMPHLHRAARLEYAKLERPLTETEMGGWP